MNILIMAAGAVGGYFGSVLSQTNEVTFIARAEHLEKMQKVNHNNNYSFLKALSETCQN